MLQNAKKVWWSLRVFWRKGEPQPSDQEAEKGEAGVQKMGVLGGGKNNVVILNLISIYLYSNKNYALCLTGDEWGRAPSLKSPL